MVSSKWIYISSSWLKSGINIIRIKVVNNGDAAAVAASYVVVDIAIVQVGLKAIDVCQPLHIHATAILLGTVVGDGGSIQVDGDLERRTIWCNQIAIFINYWVEEETHNDSIVIIRLHEPDEIVHEVQSAAVSARPVILYTGIAAQVQDAIGRIPPIILRGIYVLYLSFNEVTHRHASTIIFRPVVGNDASVHLNQSFNTRATTHIGTPIVMDLGVLYPSRRNKTRVPSEPATVIIGVAMVDFTIFHIQFAIIVGHTPKGTATTARSGYVIILGIAIRKLCIVDPHM